MVPKASSRKGRATSLRFGSSSRRRTLQELDSEGSGGTGGIVLPLEFSSDGPYDITYSLPILLGSGPSPKNFSLQVDTGSSDLWVASTSCSSSACGSTPLYDPSDATPTGLDFSIQYLIGNVSGPIVWDTMTVGNYSINTQALAAADVVQSEPLNSDFSGVLGLALPANSVISEDIPPQVGNTPDGAVWTSNLFSITPSSSAPSARFVSIALERPGSSAVPSILGIGRHPEALVPDPSLVEYDTLYQPSNDGPLFWKAAVHGITVYVNGTRIPIKLSRGASGSAFPSAALDTGTPIILTTKLVADAIYGAIGVQPASDNMYYVPCTTPLNLTVSLDSREEIAIHPLDLTTEPPSTSSEPDQCIGLIQTSADATLSNPTSPFGDMILGVPFLRNTYTVLAYDVPYANGTFPIPSTQDNTVTPFLGLLGLTNATVAMDEFHRVRVLNQPLGDQGSGNVASNSSGGRKQNVGIDVLIGLGSFAALCVLLFGVRWLLVRRSLRRGADDGLELSARDAKSRELALALGGYQLARRGGGREANDGLPTEDELRARRYEAYMHSLHTVSTDRTQIDPILEENDQYRDSFIVGKDGGYLPKAQDQPVDVLPASPSPLLAPEHSPDSARHSRVLSVNLPLLPEVAVAPGGDEENGELNPTPMTGIGTARHSANFGGSSNARGRSSASPDFYPRHLSRSPSS